MLFHVIGWTMIHSLWQCLGLLGVLKLVLGFVDMRRSGLRYSVALGVLGLAAVVVLGTCVWEWRVFASDVMVAGGVVRPVPVVVGAAVVQIVAPGASLVAWLAACCPYLSMLWVLGVVLYAGKLVHGGLALRRLRRLTGMPDVAVEAVVEGLRVRMGVARPVRLLITDRVAEPMTFGFLRAVIVLPISYVSQVPVAQLEMVVAHEMAHIRRRDYVVNLVQHVFDVLLFFNPFFRMISEMVREEREYCCDDRAAVVGGDQRAMAVALTNLGLVKRGLALGLSAASTKRRFYRRVMRLIEPAGRPGLSVRGALLGMLGAVLVVMVLTQCSRSTLAQDALPEVGDRMNQVLGDNQAGYKETVYHYTRNGREHEFFLVKTQNDREALYGYVDGMRLNGEELSKATEVLKKQRSIPLTLVVGRNVQLRYEATQDVKAAMERYQIALKNIPLDVEQHTILTRIITSNAYTDDDRRKLDALIQKRQALSPAIYLEGRK